MAYAARAQADYQKAGAGVYQQMFALGLRGLGHGLEKNDLAARKYYQDTRLCLWRTLKPKTRDVAVGLRGLGHVEQRSGDQDAAERHYRKAL
ncbi:MAG: hypothetical protein GY862_26520, partial [Gammaproteobacteria bacterium]|nr:hypothetical protein [Gammaproteobacteria bacterium]